MPGSHGPVRGLGPRPPSVAIDQVVAPRRDGGTVIRSHHANPPVEPDAFDAFEAAGWEEKAVAYERFFGVIAGRLIEPLLTAAAVGVGAKVLDVATGPGWVAAQAAARGASVVGVDVAEAMIARARSAHPELEFRRADAHELPFTDASFDAVVGNLAVMHLSRPERAIAEFARVLRPGGRLALTAWAHPSDTGWPGCSSMRWRRREPCRPRICHQAPTSSGSPTTKSSSQRSFSSVWRVRPCSHHVRAAVRHCR